MDLCPRARMSGINRHRLPHTASSAAKEDALPHARDQRRNLMCPKAAGLAPCGAFCFKGTT
ncbi:hypothetical protein Pmi06nite_52410 [Planotetraspora mira]|uniref:Uncharacterized protein n=1 Tax=Planotetraspora mira TaxID=58121 RepID=A0A8J3TWP4_9ACTN|nr:hypothetical protein Pmi06nite_52410 [Planotetraspora mira]